jgi:small-conductance mechanosensitive channel
MDISEARSATLAAVLLPLAAAAAAHALLSWAIRRATRRGERAWIDRGLLETIRPLAALLWVYGIAASLSAALAHVPLPPAAQAAAPAVAWARSIATVAALVWLLFRIGHVVEDRLHAVSQQTANTWDDILIPLAARAVRLLLPMVALILGAPALAISPELEAIFRNGVSLLLIGTVAFLLFQLVEAGEALVLRQYRIDHGDNLEARKVYTQVTVLKKVALAVIAVFALASMLMVFESVRQFGTSILASAGIAGIIIGFAAQRSIATLLAGFQIAVTQPIRIDDVVIVEGEWGRIEDITLTYVVVRIWDLRRLVLPISYFIEQPFQNWTRTSADILGTVFLYVDYTVPLQPLREELTRILSASPYWDGKVNVLQVTEAKEQTLELRALASAADASLAWDLRCEVREKLIHFLQTRYHGCLPRVRATLDPVRAEGQPA